MQPPHQVVEVNRVAQLQQLLQGEACTHAPGQHTQTETQRQG